MTYQETLDWLFNQLPNYQKMGKSAYKADLSNITLLVNELGNPHEQFKSIHVAGTNGKGSSSHMLASVLQEAGYKVGLYTSPHLKDFRERIKIDGELVSKDFVIEFVNGHKSFFEANQLSFFEMTVGMAFSYFAKEEVDIAIIEVGLGGRLDATNVISPELSLITNIGLDHTQFLGNTLESIAKEKGGIIKKDTPVVISEKQLETTEVFEQLAGENNAELIFAEEEIDNEYKTDLLGDYQQKNSKGVVVTLKKLRSFKVSDSHIKEGLLNVVTNTCLLGRWQKLGEKPLTIADTAHNVEGLSLTMAQLTALDVKNKHIVFGMVSDKNVGAVIKILPPNAIYYFCSPNSRRALDVNVLYDMAKDIGLKGKKYNSVQLAYMAAQNTANEEDVIYVGGSTFVVAEIL